MVETNLSLNQQKILFRSDTGADATVIPECFMKVKIMALCSNYTKACGHTSFTQSRNTVTKNVTAGSYCKGEPAN